MTSNLAFQDYTLKSGASRYSFPAGRISDAKRTVNVGTTVTFKRNETLFNEGDVACHSFRVVNGVVRQCMLLPDGRRQIIDFYFPGDVLSLADIEIHEFYGEAVTDVTVIRYSKNLRDLEAVDSEQYRAARDNLRSQLCRAQRHAVMLGRQTVKERVASFLIQVVERGKSEFKNGRLLNLPMCRQDIADYLGLTLETVCRTIGSLKRSRIIDIPNTHQVVLKNISLLRAIAHSDA